MQLGAFHMLDSEQVHIMHVQTIRKLYCPKRYVRHQYNLGRYSFKNYYLATRCMVSHQAVGMLYELLIEGYAGSISLCVIDSPITILSRGCFSEVYRLLKMGLVFHLV